MATLGKWTFGEGVPDVFDRHIARSVPFYAEGHALIVGLSDFLLPAGSLCVEMGCSTGTLTAAIADRQKHRDVHFVGFDTEPGMVEMAKKKSSELGNVEIMCADAKEYDFNGADLVVSYYTLQFVPLRDRAGLVQRIFDGLRPGGAFICFEKIRGECGRTTEIFRSMQKDFKLEQGYSIDEIYNKEVSLRNVMEPQSSGENQTMLLNAGFHHVEPVFRCLGWEGVVGFKRAF